MPEIRAEDGALAQSDTDAGKPMMRLGDPHDAEQLVAAAQVRELQPALERWSLDCVPTVY